MADDNISLENDMAASTACLNSIGRSPGKLSPPKNCIKPVHHDSFSELERLMKEKKPYAPTSKPTARLSPAVALNSSQPKIRAIYADSTPSPLAKPFAEPETVAEFLQKQELATSATSSEDIATSCRSQKMIKFQNMADAKFGCNSGEQNVRWHRVHSVTSSNEILCEPPNSTESLQTYSTACKSEHNPITQLTTPSYLLIENEFNGVKEQVNQKHYDLVLNRNHEVLRESQNDSEMKSHMLKYQNEVSKDQISSMCRLLAEKDISIKTQQLDIDELTRKLSDSEAKLKELGKVAGEFDYQRIIIEKLTRERDEALQASTSTEFYQTRIQDLSDTLAKRGKAIIDLRHQLMTERLKITDLEDENEDLKRHSNETELEEVRSKLREKTGLCDRQRNQLKFAETQLQHCQHRLLDVTKNGLLLQGAAHIVKPNIHAQLPKTVVGCSECYAKNLQCDNNARCRSCTERDALCARWRCSLMHKLGDCPLKPCKLPHDSQGWLVLQTERPEW